MMLSYSESMNAILDETNESDAVVFMPHQIQPYVPISVTAVAKISLGTTVFLGVQSVVIGV